MNINTIEIKFVGDPVINNDVMPYKATKGSAGMDLMAYIKEDIKLCPGKVKAIPTGIAIYIKDNNFAGLILPRSGLGHKQGLILGNSVGLIDSDYQGELSVSCWNRSTKSIIIRPFMRIAQIIFIPVADPIFEVVSDFDKTDRGEGGFGHTGYYAT